MCVWLRLQRKSILVQGQSPVMVGDIQMQFFLLL